MCIERSIWSCNSVFKISNFLLSFLVLICKGWDIMKHREISIIRRGSCPDRTTWWCYLKGNLGKHQVRVSIPVNNLLQQNPTISKFCTCKNRYTWQPSPVPWQDWRNLDMVWTYSSLGAFLKVCRHLLWTTCHPSQIWDSLAPISSYL